MLEFKAVWQNRISSGFRDRQTMTDFEPLLTDNMASKKYLNLFKLQISSIKQNNITHIELLILILDIKSILECPVFVKDDIML